MITDETPPHLRVLLAFETFADEVGPTAAPHESFEDIEVCLATGLSPRTVAKITDSLHSAGALDRCSDPDNGIRLHRITLFGMEILNEYRSTLACAVHPASAIQDPEPTTAGPVPEGGTRTGGSPDDTARDDERRVGTSGGAGLPADGCRGGPTHGSESLVPERPTAVVVISPEDGLWATAARREGARTAGVLDRIHDWADRRKILAEIRTHP